MNKAERARRDKKRQNRAAKLSERHTVAAELAKRTGRRDRRAERTSDRLEPVSDVTIEESDSR